jgi:hypothetical protein
MNQTQQVLTHAHKRIRTYALTVLNLNVLYFHYIEGQYKSRKKLHKIFLKT